MDKKSEKSEKTPNLEKVKSELEKLAGRDLPIPPDSLIKLSYPASTYNYIYDDGYVCWRSILFPFPGKSCNPTNLLDVSGVGATGANGQAVFQLSEFVCLQPTIFAEPVVVVVTPRSDDAVFATQTHAIINNSNDVQISVFTWGANGNPAPDIAFDWRVRAPFSPLIF
jgi:hypothetical protein